MLFVMVCMTNGLAEFSENMTTMWEVDNLIEGNDVPFVGTGDCHSRDDGLHWRG